MDEVERKSEMEETFLILADPDEEYVQYFLKYVRLSEFNNKVILQSFTDFEKLKQFFEKPNENILVLINSTWFSMLDIDDRSMRVVILVESNVLSTEIICPSVFKYQPLHEMISKLMRIYPKSPLSKNTKLRDKQRTKVISIYSSTGGCGKSTVSVNMANQLNDHFMKVFYLNLEAIHSGPLFINASEKDEFGQLLYYIKTKSEDLKDLIQQYIRNNLFIKCDYINSFTYYKDLEDMSSEDIQILIQALVDLNQYDLIIIDLDSSLHQRIYGSFKISDHIIWLLSDDIQCIFKTKQVWKQFANLYPQELPMINEKIKYIVNKFTGNIMNRFKEEGIHLTSSLPYIPQWKTVHQVEQLTASEVFNHHIIQLYSSLMGDMEEAIIYGGKNDIEPFEREDSRATGNV